MEVITVDSKAYKDLMEKVDYIFKYIKENTPDIEPIEKEEEMWVDSYEVRTFLRISERTLQRLRTQNIISYSILSGKSYYSISELQRLMKEKKIRSSEENMNDLISNYKLYAEQRRNIKPNR